MSESTDLALPEILAITPAVIFPLDTREGFLLEEARELLMSDFAPHALNNLWNAAIHNLRRRVEAYSIELFESVASEFKGRARFRQDGETLSERWEGVEDATLLECSLKLSLISRKAYMALSNVNWMRNHASAAHDSEERATQAEVIALALILQDNLFKKALPDPGYSVQSILHGMDSKLLNEEQIAAYSDEIRSFDPPSLRTCFGYLLSKYQKGEPPAHQNALALLPVAWELAGDELRKIAGLKYHQLRADPDADDSVDRGARTRLLEFLIQVGGVRYMPDGTRASVFRKAAKRLAGAKNTRYGWSDERMAASYLAKLGPSVPRVAFEEVYQEILASWFGNYWGNASTQSTLRPFVESLGGDQLASLCEMIVKNERASEELWQAKPRAQALAFLEEIRTRISLPAHVDAWNRAHDSLAT